MHEIVFANNDKRPQYLAKKTPFGRFLLRQEQSI